MIEEIKSDAEQRMDKSLEVLRSELTKLRTGRAHTSLLDHVKIDYYGSPAPLSQAANISVLDPRTLGVSPFDKSMVAAVEKAIMNSDLGLNPSSTGDLIRVPLPALTEERRKDLVKVVRSEAEGARVAIRNIRRDANHSFKELLKDKDITEDDAHRAEEEIQKMTDKHIKMVDQMAVDKEKELMEI